VTFFVGRLLLISNFDTGLAVNSSQKKRNRLASESGQLDKHKAETWDKTAAGGSGLAVTIAIAV